MNASNVINFIRRIRPVNQVWKLNLLVILTISLYGYTSNDPVKHVESALQYGFCMLIVLPGFCYLITKYYRSTLLGIYIALPLALFLTSQVFFLDNYFLDKLFNYNLTGGSFRRAGLTGVNDYGIMIVVCSLLILHSGSRPITVAVYMSIVFFLIVMSGSRVAMCVLIINLILSSQFTKMLFSYKVLVIIPFLAIFIKFVYENLSGLSRLLKMGFRDSEREKLLLDAIRDLDAQPWGVGFQQYLNADILFPIHNFYMLMLVELGIALGLVFIICIFLTLFTCVNTFSDRNVIPLISFLLIISTITHAYDKFLWYIPGLVLSFTITKRISKPQVRQGFHQ